MPRWSSPAGCPFRCHYCHNPGLVVPSHDERIAEEKVLDFLRSRIGKLDGVVVTGGEPTIHKDLRIFLEKMKAMGYPVKLDTSGINPEVLESLIKKGLVDYIAMDLKAPLNRYSEITGTKVNTDRIRRSIGIIMKGGTDYEFRTTVVKGQLSERDIAEIAELIPGAKMYMLQTFRNGTTLNPEFANRQPLDDREMERLRATAAKHVAVCGVR